MIFRKKKSILNEARPIFSAQCNHGCGSGVCIRDDTCRCDDGHYGTHCDKGNIREVFSKLFKLHKYNIYRTIKKRNINIFSVKYSF